MISNKGHNMICNLMTAAGKATDKNEITNSWTDLEDYVAELESLLSQMIYASIPVSNAAYNLAWQHRDQVGVHENISILDGVRNSAGKLLKGVRE